MSNSAIKCPHCNKIFLDIGNNICPFCKKNINESFDKFKEMFGEDNPFKDIFKGFN